MTVSYNQILRVLDYKKPSCKIHAVSDYKKRSYTLRSQRDGYTGLLIFNSNKEKSLHSSTVKMSSSFEQKPNFTHQNGHCVYLTA